MSLSLNELKYICLFQCSLVVVLDHPVALGPSMLWLRIGTLAHCMYISWLAVSHMWDERTVWRSSIKPPDILPNQSTVSKRFPYIIMYVFPHGLSGWRGIVIACVCPSVHPCVRPSIRKLYLVCMITQHRFELESSNLPQIYIMGYSQWVLKMEVIDYDLQGLFGRFDSKLLRKLTCLHDKPSHVWTRITKFASNMHPGILSNVIENKGHWPWLSRSYWLFWLRILGNLARLCNNM